MGETEEVKKDSALNDQTSDDKKESTSTTPPTYTKEQGQADIQKAVSDALAEQGRKHKAELEPITQERNTLKTQSEQATTRLEDTNIRIKDLEKDLDDAIGEDADLRDIAKVKQALRTERDQARLDVRAEKDAVAELKKTTEAERLEWAGTVAEAQAFKFDGELARLVDEYDGDTTANFNKLKNACDKAGIKTKEGAEAIAELYMAKKTEEPNLLDDSGVTTGAGTGIPTTKAGLVKWAETHTQAEYEEKAPVINKMMREGKIK